MIRHCGRLRSPEPAAFFAWGTPNSAPPTMSGCGTNWTSRELRRDLSDQQRATTSCRLLTRRSGVAVGVHPRPDHMHVLPAVRFDVHHHGPRCPVRCRRHSRISAARPRSSSALAAARRDPGWAGVIDAAPGPGAGRNVVGLPQGPGEVAGRDAA